MGVYMWRNGLFKFIGVDHTSVKWILRWVRAQNFVGYDLVPDSSDIPAREIMLGVLTCPYSRTVSR